MTVFRYETHHCLTLVALLAVGIGHKSGGGSSFLTTSFNRFMTNCYYQLMATEDEEWKLVIQFEEVMSPIMKLP